MEIIYVQVLALIGAFALTKKFILLIDLADRNARRRR